MIDLRLILAALVGMSAAAAAATPEHDFLKVVRTFSDAMIERGRDRYGKEHSPLFAVTLDRATLSLPEGKMLERIELVPRAEWGVRPGDRVLSGANPMLDQNFYQVLYALTELTGQAQYAAEADAAIQWFFQHCQSPETGLVAWGEHLGWDFFKEEPESRDGNYTHEFGRPWTFWDRTYELAPKEALAFAHGLWDHQISDHKTGDFSRHARYDRHHPYTKNQYPRHAGFYIATWAQAYRRSKDPVFLEAIDVLMSFRERHRNEATGALAHQIGDSGPNNKSFQPMSNISLAIDQWNVMDDMPESLAKRMRQMALATDKACIAMPHQLEAGGKGFITKSDIDTLQAEEDRTGGVSYTQSWASGYGVATDAHFASLLLLRYGQVADEGYRKLILAAADRYLGTEPMIDYPVYPAALGDVIELMLGVYRLTGDARYLDRAVHFADLSVDMFFAPPCPLPRASTRHDHYEAITGSDTLIMSLLKVWIQLNRPDAKVRLIFNDR